MNATTIGVVIAAVILVFLFNQHEMCEESGGRLMKNLGGGYECVKR